MQDIAALSNHRLDQQIYQHPDYTRGIQLSSPLSDLKEAMFNQFERDLLSQDQQNEILLQLTGSMNVANASASLHAKQDKAATDQARTKAAISSRSALLAGRIHFGRKYDDPNEF